MSEDVYRLLQQHLDRMPVPFPPTESGVEIRILRQLFTEEEAEVALALSMVPEPPSKVRKRLGRSWTHDRVVATLNSMAEKGVIERVGKGKKYSKSVLAVGIYERQLTRLTAELQRDVEQYFDEAFGRAFNSAKPRQMRTVPVNVAIAPERTVASYDDIRQFVTSTEGPFAVMDCICRHGRDLTGEPCRQTNLRETCLTFGRAARGMVESGAAHYIERDECLGILTKADNEGLVLQPQNTEEPWFVCCCCGCCCGVLRSAKLLPDPASLFHSTYRAVSDRELCSGCALCELRCQMDAIRMEEGTSVVEEARCIGCGLCVTTCDQEAMHLVPNAESASPAPNVGKLYLKMYRERFGTYEFAKALGKAVIGKQV